MQIDILTIFPNMFTSPFAESMVKRAQAVDSLKLNIHNLRDWTSDNHKTVDDRPYGGGPGMVMRVDVIDRALKTIVTSNKQQVVRKVLMSAKGNPYSQQKAQEFSKLDQLILIAGHYEGVDERVAQYLVDEELRIGDYVLTGGELPAMVVVDSVSRLLPGVLGNDLSIIQESHTQPGVLEHPQFTRPEEYNGWKVPEVLLSGNHAQIEKWRLSQQFKTSQSTSESS